MMVIEPEKLVEPFAKAGADMITFHIEATDNPQSVIDLIRSTGKQVGISLKPSTSVAEIEPFFEHIDLILVMSVEPGFGGQGYLDGSTERIQIKQKLVEQCLQDRVLIEVDGGIKLHNAKEVIDAGGDVLVAGSAIFGTEDPVQTMKEFLQSLIIDMRSYEDIDTFTDWEAEEKNQFALAVTKGLIMDMVRKAN